jgi:hypothetical protein
MQETARQQKLLHLHPLLLLQLLLLALLPS